jgi:hypothetical protein
MDNIIRAPFAGMTCRQIRVLLYSNADKSQSQGVEQRFISILTREHIPLISTLLTNNGPLLELNSCFKDTRNFPLNDTELGA